MVPISDQPIHLVGIYLPARLAEMLKNTSRLENSPRYFALNHSSDHVQRLFEALRAPAEAQIATVSIQERYDAACFGVPFEDLRVEARYALDGFYLFEEEDVPEMWSGRERLHFLVIPFVEALPKQGEDEALLRLPMRLSPPWEMVEPSYIGCMEVSSRISRFTPALLQPESYLALCTLQVEDRAENARRFRVAPISAARPDARVLLLGTDTTIFCYFYRKTMREHPLLNPYWRVLEPGVLGD
jgi:hypothetical protein